MSNLPTVNPLASYPLKSIVGRTNTVDTLKANFMDPRGPVYVDYQMQAKPACVGIDSRRQMDYEKMRNQAYRNRDGSGYLHGTLTASGRSVLVTAQNKKIAPAVMSSAAGKKAAGSKGPGNEVAQAIGFSSFFKRLI